MTTVVIAETVRRHLRSLGYIVFVLLLAMVGIFVATFNTPGAIWPWLVTVLSIITGSAVIGPEFSTGTLQLIVSRPIRRSWYVLSRAAGVFLSVSLAAIVGFASECVARFVIGRAIVPWQRLTNTLIGALMVSLLAIALLTFLGSITRSYFNVAIYLGAQVVLSTTETIFGLLRVRGGFAGRFLAHHPGIESSLVAFDDFLFPAVPTELHRDWLLRLATVAVALALACLTFERREVPYGAE